MGRGEEDGATSYGIKKEVGSATICLFMIPSHSILSSDMCHYPAGRPQIKFSFSLGPHAGPRLKISGENIGYSSGFQRGPPTKKFWTLYLHLSNENQQYEILVVVSTQLVLLFYFVLACTVSLRQRKTFNNFLSILF